MYLPLRPKHTTEHMQEAMLNACEQVNIKNWNTLKPLVSSELSSFILMLTWIKEMKQKNEMNAEQARIHIDIQKNTTRTRLMALPEITMIQADQLLNQSIDAIRKEIFDYLGWVII